MRDSLLNRLVRGRLFRRAGHETGPIRLDRRRIYILPTRAGVVFGVILLAMLLGAINYSNSLGFALTFLLASLTFVSIVHTFRNLHGLTFRPGHARPVFAGEEAVFPLAVENDRPVDRFGVNLGVAGRSMQAADVPGRGVQWLRVRLPATQRGRLVLPGCTVSTRFPVGLFHAWGHVHPRAECLVYPRPAPRQSLPGQTPMHETAFRMQGQGGDDFSNLRGYQPGDSLRRVHWKAVARGQPLMTKEFGGEGANELWLDWEHTPGNSTEERLSILCRWVLEAEERNLRYGLTLPGTRLGPGQGETHRHSCLESLALFGGVE